MATIDRGFISRLRSASEEELQQKRRRAALFAKLAVAAALVLLAAGTVAYIADEGRAVVVSRAQSMLRPRVGGEGQSRQKERGAGVSC